jgi:hypothetical protein
MGTLMPREPSAADALYPHLRSQLPERPTQQRPSDISTAHAMFPKLVPKPKPPSDPYLAYMHALGFRVDERRR